MKQRLARWGWKWIYAYNMAHAYLASNMGEHDVKANFESAAYEAERQLYRMRINRG